MRNEPWVWPEVRDAGTSGAGAVPLRSAQMMGQQKKKKKKKKKTAHDNRSHFLSLINSKSQQTVFIVAKCLVCAFNLRTSKMEVPS